ncbi:MAG: hypothetical protein V9G20_30175 [Candidatus Promineifilaceae bacterium]
MPPTRRSCAIPTIEILNAPYLNDHPLVIDTFLDRLREMLVGQNLMNCSLCKYREQVLGFEAEVGLAQESHHHHVEGIGGGLEDCPCAGDCDSSCRDEAFCVAHNLPWTPVHAHDHHHGHDHGPRSPHHGPVTTITITTAPTRCWSAPHRRWWHLMQMPRAIRTMLRPRITTIPIRMRTTHLAR